MRGSPGDARRRTASAARTSALSSRGIEPWPHVPLTWIAEHLEALLRDLDRVEPAPGELDAHAARLVERPGRLEGLRPVGREPVDAVDAAGLLVRRARRTARRAGDRGWGRGPDPGRRPGLGGRGAARPWPRARPSASCPRSRGPTRSRRRRPRRTGRASSRRRRWPGRRRGGRAGGAGSPPVPSPRSRRSTLPRPGVGSTTSGSSPSERKTDARCSATASSAPGGSGGLTDGIRMIARSSSTSSACAASQAGSPSAAEGSTAGSGIR